MTPKELEELNADTDRLNRQTALFSKIALCFSLVAFVLVAAQLFF